MEGERKGRCGNERIAMIARTLFGDEARVARLVRMRCGAAAAVVPAR
jgi:hypothetical protein